MRLERALAAAEDAQVQRHVAQRDRRRPPLARRSRHTSRSTRELASRPQPSEARLRFWRDGLILAQKLPEQVGIAAQQRLAQAEELDLLDRVVIGQQVLQVLTACATPAPARRARERSARHTALGDERRDRRRKEDERQQGLKRTSSAANESSVMTFWTR